MAKSIVFIDTEVGVDDHKIHDIGAVRQDRAYFHSASVRNFVEFIAGAEYICGHNILHHDLKYIHDSLGYELRVTVIDTLYLSPLLFPKRPYHALLKDDKLQTEQLNDPVNDCQKAASLFYDEVNAFFDLPPKVKQIFCCLLYDHPEFSGFFQYVNFRPYKAKIYELIHMEYEGRICTNADLLPLIRHYPVELAYALALIGANDEHSITPPWLLKNYPKIENVIKYLRGTPCANGCTYCHNALDIHRELKRIFGYDSFRTYKANQLDIAEQEGKPVQFSLIELYHAYIASPNLTTNKDTTSLTDIEDALLYLSKIGALKLEGGFLVLYNGMEIKRLITDNRIKYKVDDYRFLDEFYKQKIRQIHIVGEYANLMVRDYQAALQFVQDYFQMDFRKFVTKYFKGERIQDIDRNITPQKYHQLFGELSDKQSQIINDADSKYIVVAAGPGSGKTRVLVHKLAALLLLEDVKHEQLLMLTFSRAAATEFKKRLIELIGNAANFVEIKTFHSYCFDLLGKIGSLEGVDDVVKNAAEMIKNGEVEQGKIVKSVLVIDEAQDMDANEFDLISAMMQANDDMRVIAVGDDDQNIYAFRGSDSKYLRTLIENRGATKYEMTENYRSGATIVALANSFAKTIQDRMKLAPVEAVREDCGIVRITHHHEKHMETAVVNEVISTQGNSQCCILTNTNDEALRLLGLLTKSGIRAKLIQSLDGFRLYNLVEVRYFLKKIDAGLKSPVISNDLWNRAKEHLFDAYAGSPCLEICGNLIRDFEETNPTKYRTDLEEFIRESNYEDFYPDDHEIVFISTIHKAKGREFDTVYMMLDGNTAATDEEKRKLYVGMTRAKNALYIHCNTELFSAIAIPEIEYIEDQNCYEEPTELTLQLTHRDVVLDFFKGKKELLLKLRSGMALSLIDCYLLAKLNGKTVRIAKLSKACKDRIESLLSKGYCPVSAEIRFIVAWKKEGDADETPVVLPDIHFQKELSIK